MSDVTGDANDKKKQLEQMTNSPFFNFAKPYLDFIAKGKVFGIVYLIMAAINLILPFVVLYTAIDSGVFQFGAKYVFAIILSWIVFVFACWIGFQLWYGRRKDIESVGSAQFVATVMFSEIFQTFGEWIGTMVGIIGAGAGLVGSIFLGSDVDEALRYFGLRFGNIGIAVIIVGPIVGCFIILISRFLAEQLRMFAALVNNTAVIAKNSGNGA